MLQQEHYSDSRRRSNSFGLTRVGTLALSTLDRAFARTESAPETVYECPRCEDTGLAEAPDRYGVVRAGTCICAVRRRHRNMCKNAGFDLAEAKTLADYQGWNQAALLAKRKAEAYIRDFDTIRRQPRNWFIVNGQSGSGKTMLCRAIVKALLERPDPVKAVAVKYYAMMQELKAHSNSENYHERLDRYTDCEVLFIDDFLKEKLHGGDLTEADIKHLFAVLDSRYDAYRPTIITTELSPSRIDQLNEAFYGRMLERAYTEIVFDDKASNFRKRIINP